MKISPPSKIDQRPYKGVIALKASIGQIIGGGQKRAFSAGIGRTSPPPQSGNCYISQQNPFSLPKISFANYLPFCWVYFEFFSTW
jgi:hypothetical protein